LRDLLGLAHRLVRPDDVPARLAGNARSDGQAGVRAQNLVALIRGFPDHPVTREALSAAREDHSDKVRLRAGLALGRDGRELLLEIARAEEGDDVSASRAVAALEADLSVADVQAILGHALRRRRLRTAESCLAWLGRRGKDEDVETLVKVLALKQGDLAVAAAKALGALGSASAVLPLREAAERHAGDEALKQAVRQAVAAIQSRLTGTPGELSLAGDEAGQLTLSEDDGAGRLSLAPPDRLHKT
jgi:HEAT repeat protein